MRFPICKEKSAWGTKYLNLSQALQESLQDKGIINPETGNSRRKYFSLPIEEGPLLTCLSWFYDMSGGFHVGCTVDLRPPSFGFAADQGSGDTLEGCFSLNYHKKLKLSVFLDSGSFRNAHEVRDLDALAEAYNNRDNCTETISLLWNGPGKFGFSNIPLVMNFNDQYMTQFDGIGAFDEKYCGFESPLYGSQTPFYSLGKGTKLEEIAKKYHHNKNELSHHHPQFMYMHILSEMGYAPGDALLGILQISEKVLKPKRNLRGYEGKIDEALSSYKTAPQNFDFLKENRLYFRLGGGDR